MTCTEMFAKVRILMGRGPTSAELIARVIDAGQPARKLKPVACVACGEIQADGRELCAICWETLR